MRVSGAVVGRFMMGCVEVVGVVGVVGVTGGGAVLRRVGHEGCTSFRARASALRLDRKRKKAPAEAGALRAVA